MRREERRELIQKAIELRKKGYTYREIGKILGKSKSTIQSWLSPYEKKAKQLAYETKSPEIVTRVSELQKAISDLRKQVYYLEELAEKRSPSSSSSFLPKMPELLSHESENDEEGEPFFTTPIFRQLSKNIEDLVAYSIALKILKSYGLID
jgi:predicted transcriptional regulator